MYKKIDFDMFDRDALRVARGGTWGSIDRDARGSRPCNYRVNYTNFYLGIRLCRDLSTSQEAETPATGSEHAQES